MNVPPKKQAMNQIAMRLVELIFQKEQQEFKTKLKNGVMKAGQLTFVIEWASSGATAPVAMAIEQAKKRAESTKGSIVIPLVAVSFMGKAGSKRCKEAKVSWLDLSGNVQITAEGRRIYMEGLPNK